MYKLKDGTIRAINYTRYVALPKQWLQNMGLEEGSKITMWLNRTGNIEIAPADTLPREQRNAASIPVKELPA